MSKEQTIVKFQNQPEKSTQKSSEGSIIQLHDCRPGFDLKTSHINVGYAKEDIVKLEIIGDKHLEIQSSK